MIINLNQKNNPMNKTQIIINLYTKNKIHMTK